MANVRVDRLRIRCRADRQGEAAALRTRARLARLAAEVLPAALDRAFGGEPVDAAPVVIDRLVVPITFDLDRYDDETVVALWAHRFAIELSARVAAERATAAGRPEPVPAERHGGPAAPGDGDPVAAVADRIVRLAPGALAALARELAAMPHLVERLAARLDPAARAAVLAAVRASAAGTGGGTGTGGPGGSGTLDGAPRSRSGAGPAPRPAMPAVPAHFEEPAGAAPETEGGFAGWAAAWRDAAAVPEVGRAGVGERRPVSPMGAGAGGEVGRAEAAAARSVAALLTRMLGGDDPAVSRAWWSRAGGLLLLYPWLRDHLDAAAAARPDLAAPEARTLALAALADPADPVIIADPLVALLAGHDPTGPTAAHPPGAAVTGDPALEVAVPGGGEAVLAAFAAVLPGFAGSTPEFVRARFVLRPARLAAVPAGPAAPPGGVAVRLAASPLDPALARLPYPLGPVRLPWTPTIHVHLEAT